MKTKLWLLGLGALLLICGVLSVVTLLPAEPAAKAEVWSDGKLLYTLDLAQDQVRTVESAYGTNVITVCGGKIGVTEADCPDSYCMARGMCDSGIQIVCLPNRLVIKFVGKQTLDAVVK